MKAVYRVRLLVGASVLLVSFASAQVGSALCYTCRDEEQCEPAEYYPCGQNEDGTIIYCVTYECGPVEVCGYEPCDGGSITFEFPPLESFPGLESLPPLESLSSF